MQKMEQTSLNSFFPVRKHRGADVGRKRKRTESSREVASSNLSRSCSEVESKTVSHGEKQAGKKVLPPSSASSPLRAGSRGMAMLRLAQQKSKTPGRSTQPSSDSKPEESQPSSHGSESPRLQRFRSVEFVSPKKRCASCTSSTSNCKTFSE